MGDGLLFFNKETGECFGSGEITDLDTKTLGSLEEADWSGHERFDSEVIMLATYRGYYGEKVNLNSEVKLIKFNFK